MVLRMRHLIENAAPVSWSVQEEIAMAEDGSQATSPYVGMFRYKQIISRAKILSQILAYLWLYLDPHGKSERTLEEKEKEAFLEKVVGWFLKPVVPRGISDFERLMIAKPEDTNDYGRFLSLVYPKEVRDKWNEEQKAFYTFPIFDPDDILNQRFSFELDPGVFDGYFTDPDEYSPHSMKVVLAFPPRPQLSKMTVTTDDLKDWLENYKTDSDNFLPPNPYIPTCCS